jgi:hypothetical protein
VKDIKIGEFLNSPALFHKVDEYLLLTQDSCIEKYAPR